MNTNKIKKIAIVTGGMVQPRVELFEKLSLKYDLRIDVYQYTDWWESKSDVLKMVNISPPRKKLCIANSYVRIFDYLRKINVAVLKEIRKEKYDIYISYGYGSFVNFLVACLAKIQRKPYILFSDARYDFEKNRPLLFRLGKKVFNSLCTSFIASGEDTKVHLLKNGISENRIGMSYYAIDNNKFWDQKLVDQRDELRDQYSIPESCKIILTISRLVETKGIWIAIKAFEKVKCSNALLIVVGDGVERESCEQYCSDKKMNVKFVGSVPHEETKAFYAMSDIFVLASPLDVWGLVINEAMVYGLPVISTDGVGAASSMIVSGEEGYVVEKNDCEELAIKLNDLLEDDVLRIQMGEKAQVTIGKYDICKSLYSLGHIINKVSL